MIGHGGLLRAFSFARPIRCSGHVQGIYPQMAEDLGFAVQFNAETLWHFGQLRYPRIINRKGNSIHPPRETQCQTLYCLLLKATTAYTSACTEARAALTSQLSG